MQAKRANRQKTWIKNGNERTNSATLKPNFKEISIQSRPYKESKDKEEEEEEDRKKT